VMGTVPELTAYRRWSLSKSREGGTNKAVAIIDFVDQGRKGKFKKIELMTAHASRPGANHGPSYARYAKP